MISTHCSFTEKDEWKPHVVGVRGYTSNSILRISNSFICDVINLYVTWNIPNTLESRAGETVLDMGMSLHPHCVFHGVQMDFTRTFQTNAKLNNINHVWSHFCKILVVLKYHRRLWANIFDTDICRSITIPKKAKYTILM